MYHQVAADAVCRSGKYQIQDVAMDVHVWVALHTDSNSVKREAFASPQLHYFYNFKVIIEVSNQYKTDTSWQATNVPCKLIQEDTAQVC